MNFIAGGPLHFILQGYTFVNGVTSFGSTKKIGPFSIQGKYRRCHSLSDDTLCSWPHNSFFSTSFSLFRRGWLHASAELVRLGEIDCGRCDLPVRAGEQRPGAAVREGASLGESDWFCWFSESDSVKAKYSVLSSLGIPLDGGLKDRLLIAVIDHD